MVPHREDHDTAGPGEQSACLTAGSSTEPVQNALSPPEATGKNKFLLFNPVVEATSQNAGSNLQATSEDSSMLDTFSRLSSPLKLDSSSITLPEKSTEGPPIPHPRLRPGLNSNEPEHRATCETTTPITRNPAPMGPAAPRKEFALSMAEMGENLVPNIMPFLSDDAYPGKIVVRDLPPIDWAEFQQSMPSPLPPGFQLGMRHSRSKIEGVGYMKLAPSLQFKFPDLPQAIEEPSREACLSYLDQTINNPPRAAIHYYVGTSLCRGPQSRIVDDLLHPGEQLSQAGNLDGVNTPWLHAGETGSGTAFHTEDFDLYSVNLVFVGYKLWILIRLSHMARFEEWVKQNWPVNKCDQFIRHNSLLVSPDTLKKEGIEFDIVVAGPGQMVVTRPGQAHAVVNVTPCIASAINFLPPGVPIVPARGPVACPLCGLYGLQLDGINRIAYAPVSEARKRQNLGSASAPTDGTKRTKTTPQPGHAGASKGGLGEWMKAVTKRDKLCRFPSMESKATPKVYGMATAIWGRGAVDQFQSLVSSTRDRLTNNIRSLISDDPGTRAIHHAQDIMAFDRGSTLQQFLTRLSQVWLVEEIERVEQRSQLDCSVLVEDILGSTNWTRRRLQTHRETGKKWKRVCGDHNALLCFISLASRSPFNLVADTYLDMTDEELGMFHDLLDHDYTKSIYSAGEAFLKSLNMLAADTEFTWESQGSFPVYQLPEEELLSCLQPFPSNAENIYDRRHFTTDPTVQSDSNQRQCQLCTQATCNCIHPAPARTMPRIKDYGEKGLGLQAVAPAPGEPAYRAGDLIGEATGVLEPGGTHRDGWTVAMPGNDLQIYRRDHGNWTRLANHACKGFETAAFAPMLISGKMRMMMVAVTEIQGGDEITVYCGEGFMEQGKCRCKAHEEETQ